MHSNDTSTVYVSLEHRSRLQIALKRSIQCLFFVLALPRLASYAIARCCLGPRAFSASSESIARVPGIRGVYLRQAFYRCLLEHCGQDSHIGWGTLFSMTEARLGARVYIGRNCNIGFGDIGDEAMLADNVIILSGGHEHDSRDLDCSMHEQGQTFRRVSIGTGTWIGAAAVLMADVGEHAIVGAGAVVNRPIPAGAIAVGVPAKVVKYRDGWNEHLQVSKPLPSNE